MCLKSETIQSKTILELFTEIIEMDICTEKMTIFLM